MEILYARYGGYVLSYYIAQPRLFSEQLVIDCFDNMLCLCLCRGNLEREMKLLFGNRLRAEGGDGTLNLDT